MNIDPKVISCFGFTLPRKDSWYVVLHQVASKGWRAIDVEKFEKVLNENVLAAYNTMVDFQFKDLDTDTDFVVSFDNIKKMWKLTIPGSPDDAVSAEDKKAVFKDEYFKRTCKRADEILSNAVESCNNMITPELENGRFINLDETKYEAILDMLADPQLRKNLKTGKYIK